MNIKLCAFADESGAELKTQIDNLHKNGIFALELRSVNGTNVSELKKEQAKEIYKQLLDNEIEVWSLGSPLGKIEIAESEQEHFNMLKKLIEIAHVMNTDKIRMFSYFVSREEYSVVSQIVIDRLNKMVEYARSEGIKLCHENESAIYGATVDNCVKLYENVEGLYSVYDPANFLMWDEDINYALKKLYDKALYFHVKDVISATKQIVPSGFGDGQIDRMVMQLNRDATFTIEPHLHVFEGYNSIDKKELTNKFEYPDQPTAFKAAIDAFKNILKNNGFSEGYKGIWTK